MAYTYDEVDNLTAASDQWQITVYDYSNGYPGNPSTVTMSGDQGVPVMTTITYDYGVSGSPGQSVQAGTAPPVRTRQPSLAPVAFSPAAVSYNTALGRRPLPSPIGPVQAPVSQAAESFIAAAADRESFTGRMRLAVRHRELTATQGATPPNRRGATRSVGVERPVAASDSRTVTAISLQSLTLTPPYHKLRSPLGAEVGGVIASDTVWDLASSPYTVTSDVTVNSGVPLTVEPGVEVRFNGSTGLYVNGALWAVGMVGQPIMFTANMTAPVAESWDGIYFGDSSDDALTRLKHCTVSYGGQTVNYDYHAWYGNLNLHSASPTIQNCVINDSGNYGLQLYNNSLPSVISNTMSGNGSYGLYNESSVTVTAKNNWWGLPSGPYHPTLNPSGQGDRVSDYVDFEPWLDAPPWADKTGLVYGVSIQSQGATALALRFAYNGLHQITNVDANAPIAQGYEFTYDLASNLTRVWPSGSDPGVVGAYGYDVVGNLAALTNTHTGGALIHAFSYDVDNLGNVTSIDDGSDATTYTYDDLYRLSGVAYPGGATETYTYDAEGNRLSKAHSVDGTVTCTYNGANQLTASTANGGATYAYDANGNLRTRTDAGGTTTFIWNHEDQLTRIDYADATYSAYSYDGLGQRLSKRDRQGNVTYYVYAGRSLALELNGDGNTQAAYIYTPDTDRPLAVVRVGATYHLLYDHLGSVISLADGAGGLAASYQYDPWGNLLGETGSVANPVRFAGQLYDAESGLYYMRNRYYDPAIGRFISRDPFVEEWPSPGRLNLYAYADNNPLNVADAFGLLTVNEAAQQINDALNSTAGKIGVDLAKQIAKQGGGLLRALSARVSPSAGNALLGVMTTFLSPEGAEAMRGALNIVKAVRREQRVIDDLYNRGRRRGGDRFVLRPGIHNAGRRIREARRNSRVLNFLLSP